MRIYGFFDLGFKCMMSSDEKIVAVLPAFNEERTIGKVLLRQQKFVDGSADLIKAIDEKALSAYEHVLMGVSGFD